MERPTLFHDPTSEPSRAVHWFAIEAGIELAIEHVWLTRGEHRDPRFLVVNPAHQVPALRHGDLCLAEGAAIMIYLAELAGVEDRWIGATAAERAETHRFLSWHHTNTRRRLTLDYLLPVLLMPAYKNDSSPDGRAVATLRARARESLALLEVFLEQRGEHLGGEQPSLADLFIAPDLFALDADPERGRLFGGVPAVAAWLERLRRREGYAVSHGPWNAVVPRVLRLLRSRDPSPRDPRWVADVCLGPVF